MANIKSSSSSAKSNQQSRYEKRSIKRKLNAEKTSQIYRYIKESENSQLESIRVSNGQYFSSKDSE